MRAARLIKMVLLLQSRPMMTAAELAAELEVSERTITRDAQALSEAGVPVYADRGRAGGYRLIGGYRTRLTGLGRSEAEALFLSGLPGALREMGLEDAASAARLKVSAALLPSLRDASASAAQRFHLDAPGWYQEPVTPELLPAVAEAVWGDFVMEARYGKRSDRVVERRLEPYGLVLKGGIWYVCARAESGDFRVYRLDRFTAVTVTTSGFTRDEGFDLPAFWESRAAEFSRSLLRTEAELRLSPAGVRGLARVMDPPVAREALAAAGPPDAEGWVRVTVPVESVEVATAQLLPLGAEAEALGPPELRSSLASAAKGLYRLYG
ncbi:transcriptional regulator [Streptomyces spiroverticillatus]|uniref:Transcriptional regulator n=1 Tax=Streptomyces finlayi TaxID=67296 RepID=A0A918X2T6_9ACTN|nr:YafY family protein [Streptomyces finlayi]GGZ93805.1 transcriptional regulator [Streptomyces spiroverticillatus]GHD06322.1 transcriptional regulator [Streptomyces finlayi]